MTTKKKPAKIVRPSPGSASKGIGRPGGPAKSNAKTNKDSAVFGEIYRNIKRIPRGKVATYGDIALLCDERISARTVGWALNASPAGVPWQRVVSATGWLSIGRRSLISQALQRDLLLAEGVPFEDEFTVAIDQCRWQPRRRRTKIQDRSV